MSPNRNSSVNAETIQHNNNRYAAQPISLNDNERSYAIDLISEINAYLTNKDMPIKRAGGERTINGRSFVKFPDVLLFSDKTQSMILQGWEIKCPDVRIDDEDFVVDAHNKANLLNCNSCILWNFQYAQLHIKNDNGNFDIAETWTISNTITDRASIETYRTEWIVFLHQLIDEISSFITTGRIKHRSLGEVITESVMPQIISQNKGLVAEELKKQNARDVQVSIDIGTWWETAKTEYTLDESNMYSAYAKMLLLNWLNKLTFANIIQTHYEGASIIKDISEGCKVVEAVDIFSVITKRCDFFNMFSPVSYGDALPDQTWDDLVSFNQLLQTCDVSSLEADYQHRLLEDNIAVAKRQIAGQYPTPEPLAQLMAGIAIRNAEGESWDCCCGTGTVGCALWQRKNDLLADVYSNSSERAFQTTWLSDIHDFPLQVATLSMSSLSQIETPLLVFQHNVFNVAAGLGVKFTDPATGALVSRKIPKFDSIASNLPFVDFNTKEIAWYDSIKKHAREELKRTENISLSNRNDLYCYIALYLSSLLSDHGVACLLTSSSWLFSNAGGSFFDALRSKFNVSGVYINGKNRWFSNADVMNAVLVLEPKLADKRPIRFGIIDAGVDELGSDNIRNSIIRSILGNSNQAEGHFCEHVIDIQDIERYRAAGLSLYSMCFDLTFIDKVLPKLCKISDHFSFTREIKSGQNDAFYSNNPNFVDEDFRFGLVKDLSDTETYEIEPNMYVMNCNQSEEYLSKYGYDKTLRHIKSFTGRLNQSVMSHRPYWYTLPNASSFVLATAMNPDKRLFFARAAEGSSCYADQRVIGLTPVSAPADIDLSLALLNTTLSMFLLEANAGPMALGALDTSKTRMSQLMMLDPSFLSSAQRIAILKAFEPLKNRPIMETEFELYQPDRKNFDSVVMRAFGIENAYQSIVDSLLAMQNIRLR